jgi:protoporphyrin/coproporphyrin ferrochelatase
MKDDGIKRALAFATSPYSSYSGCRQYRENIAAAQLAAGEGAPAVDKIRPFFNHPGLIEASTARLQEAIERLGSDRPSYVLFTAHSIPLATAENSDYVKQLEETCRLVAEAAGVPHWKLVYQSRSGAPGTPWLGPDVLEHLDKICELGVRNVVVSPVGFISDHMEVLYDLDIEAKDLAVELGMTLVRASTVGTHPAFIRMIRELISERVVPGVPKLAIGRYGPRPGVCLADCCPAPVRAGRRTGAISSLQG